MGNGPFQRIIQFVADFCYFWSLSYVFNLADLVELAYAIGVAHSPSHQTCHSSACRQEKLFSSFFIVFIDFVDSKTFVSDSKCRHFVWVTSFPTFRPTRPKGKFVFTNGSKDRGQSSSGKKIKILNRI